MRGNFLSESDGNLILRVPLLLRGGTEGQMGMEEMGRMGKKKRSVWHYWAQKMAKRTLPRRLVNLLKRWQEVRGRWTKWPRRPWGSPWTPGRACRTLALWLPLVQLPPLPSSLPGNWGSVRSTDFHHTKGCCLMTWRAFSPGSTDLHYFHNSPLACFQLCQLSAAIWPIDWFSGTWQTGLKPLQEHTPYYQCQGLYFIYTHAQCPAHLQQSFNMSFPHCQWLHDLLWSSFLNWLFNQPGCCLINPNHHHLFSELKQTKLAMHF